MNEYDGQFGQRPAVVAFRGFYDAETQELVEAKLEAGVWLAERVRVTFEEAAARMSEAHTINHMVVLALAGRPLTQDEAIKALEARDFRVIVEQEIIIAIPEMGDDAAAMLKGSWSGYAAPLGETHEQHARFVDLVATTMLSRRDAAVKNGYEPSRGSFIVDIEKGTMERTDGPLKA